MPLIVFLHGLGQMPQAWQDQVTAMPAGWKAVAPWVRGTRPGRDDTFEVDAAADDVLALLNQQGVEQFALVGVSLGAVVALNAAIRAPETVSQLVLASGMINPPASMVRLQKFAMRAVPASRFLATGIPKDKALQVMDALAATDLRGGLPRVSAETLVVCGAADKVNLPASRELAAGIPGARLELVPNAGADVNREAPDAFNELLWGFLPPVPAPPNR